MELRPSRQQVSPEVSPDVARRPGFGYPQSRDKMRPVAAVTVFSEGVMQRELVGLAFWWFIGCVSMASDGDAEPPTSRFPVIYSTDLLHPHDDPDDHYDLATLFALPELDVRGIVLDLGERQQQRMGRPPVEQILHLAGRRVPYVRGVNRPLSTHDDRAADVPPEFQGGIELILSTLRESQEKVVLFTTGSLRDVAAAFNREPELLRAKVRALYFNAGNGPGGRQDEWNVKLDPKAYQRVFESGLPLYWCPCFGRDGYQTFFVVDQRTAVSACRPPLQNFFVYGLTKSREDPIAFLASVGNALPEGPRNMWCTGPLYHAAGRRIYQRGPDDFVALTLPQAQQLGLQTGEIAAFAFQPFRATIAEDKPNAPPALPDLADGAISAAFLGADADRVGTRQLKPDGQPDCHARVLGVDANKTIKNLVLTSPHDGRWEQLETGRWWRLGLERTGRQLDVYFQFYAAGEHHAEIVYADGTKQAASFAVPDPAVAELRVELDPSVASGCIFRQTDPRFGQILAACLTHTLAGFADK
jgi:hypothetical protein